MVPMDPTTHNDDEARPPDWVIDLDHPPVPLPPEVVSHLAEIERLSAELAVQDRAISRIGRALTQKVDAAFAAGIPVVTIADHSQIRPGPLEAYRAGTHPLFPGGPLYVPSATPDEDKNTTLQ